MQEEPETLLLDYMKHIEEQEYDEMYSMLDSESCANIDKEYFVDRNSKIYEGMEISNLKISNIIQEEERNGKKVKLSYDSTFQTIAGVVDFKNEATFVNTKDGYKLLWKDSLIVPKLEKTDKIRITTSQAERGDILDRNGRKLTVQICLTFLSLFSEIYCYSEKRIL